MKNTIREVGNWVLIMLGGVAWAVIFATAICIAKGIPITL